MELGQKLLLFAVSLVGVLGGSVVLSRSVSSIGRALKMPEQFVGFLTALGADSPEIASAIVAMIAGHQDVGAGVVFGSNLFNLASLLGLAAVIGGGIRVQRRTVLLNGGVGLAITALAVLLALGVGPRFVLVALIVLIPIPYAAVLWLRRGQLAKWPLPFRWTEFLASASSECKQHGREIQEDAEENNPSAGHPATGKALWSAGFALVLIIGGSIGLVHTTTQLTSGWLPRALLGPLVLAGLTGIPNVYTATRLAMRHRGGAVLTEAMNSNLLNIVAGLAIPSLVFGGMSLSRTGAVDTIWLLGLTIAATAVAAWRRGLGRVEGAAVIAAYLGFVVVRIHTVL